MSRNARQAMDLLNSYRDTFFPQLSKVNPTESEFQQKGKKRKQEGELLMVGLFPCVLLYMLHRYRNKAR